MLPQLTTVAPLTFTIPHSLPLTFPKTTYISVNNSELLMNENENWLQMMLESTEPYTLQHTSVLQTKLKYAHVFNSCRFVPDCKNSKIVTKSQLILTILVYPSSSWEQIGNQNLSGRKFLHVEFFADFAVCPDLIRNRRLLTRILFTDRHRWTKTDYD